MWENMVKCLLKVNVGESMINFIVVDDNKHFVTEVSGYINEQMMKNNFEYRIHPFYDYDEKFFKKTSEIKTGKVYILDIETKSASGIDIARHIRKDDVDSVIIFVTAHDELGSSVIKEQLMFLTFLCKFTDFERNFKEAIDRSLIVLNRKTAIRFSDASILYTIPIKDILYITRDSVERKSIIKTDYAIYKVGKTLVELHEMSNGQLKYSHRACLVNPDRIRLILKNSNTIEFDNGETTDLLSNNYKKELIKC